MRGATVDSFLSEIPSLLFQPTPLMRGATLDPRDCRVLGVVSTHAPHARGDFGATEMINEGIVSTHAPHARGDRPSSWHPCHRHGRFNPRPSCEGRLCLHVDDARLAQFQPTPLMRGATGGLRASAFTALFQPTPLMRGATAALRDRLKVLLVSTHAPHARGDAAARLLCRGLRSFNPRPSCEGRPIWPTTLPISEVFQPTPLMRGATLHPSKKSNEQIAFQPTPLMRGATPVLPKPSLPRSFQPTPLMRGATRCSRQPLL